MVDAFTEEDPASHECLLAALLSPAVSARLWRPGVTLRADCWPGHLQPTLQQAAGQRGFSVTPISAGAHLFVREVGPVDAGEWPELRYVTCRVWSRSVDCRRQEKEEIVSPMSM